MSIHAALRHLTLYTYDRPVTLGPQVLRLRPAPHCRTRILSYSLRVAPEKHFINWQQDPQANYLARLVFSEPTNLLRIEVDLVAEMAVINPFDFFLEPYAEQFPFEYEPGQRHELEPYLRREPLTPLFDCYLRSIPRAKTRSVNFLFDLNEQLSRDIKYLIRLEPGVQTPEVTLAKRSGSCRDSGWLLVQLLRHLGLAARFVSGYLIQLTPDVKFWTALPARRRTLPISMPGPRCICPGPAGSVWTRPRGYSPGKATCRLPARRSRDRHLQ